MNELIYMSDIQIFLQMSTLKAFKFEVIGDDWCCLRLIEGLSGMVGVTGGWLVVAFAAWMWFGKLHTATWPVYALYRAYSICQ